MYSICSAFFVLTTSSVSHADFLRDLGLPPEHTADLLRVCFSDSLACRVLTRTKGNQTELITIVGELHDQTEKTYVLGATLLRHYPIIGLEGAKVLYVKPGLISWDPSVQWLPKFWFPKIESKEVSNASEISPKYAFSLLTQLRANKSHSCSKSVLATLEPQISPARNHEAEKSFAVFSKQMAACNFALACGIVGLGAYLELLGYSLSWNDLCIGTAGFCSLGAALCTRGVQIESEARQLGITGDMPARDRLMTQMLLKLSEDAIKAESKISPKRSFVASAVGKFHLYGITKGLIENGFVNRSWDVIALYNAMKQKDPKALSETGFRDISDPLDPFVVSNFTNSLPQVFLSYPELSKNFVTPLMFDSIRGDNKELERFLKKGDDVNAQASLLPIKGSTALHFATFSGHLEIVKALIAYGAHVNVPTDQGHTPLSLAVLSERRETDIAEFLIKNGADVDPLIERFSPLTRAAQDDNFEHVQLFLKHKADVNGASGVPPLVVAAQNNHKSVVEILVKNKANIDADTKPKKLTALMQASQNGHIDIVRLLLKSKANVNMTDSDGFSAVQKAQLNGHTEIVELLKGAGDVK